MVIGYEAKRYFHNNSGLGNYARHLIRILGTHFPEDSYLLYNPKPSQGSYPIPSSAKEVLPKNQSAVLRNVWRQKLVSTQAKMEGVQIFHGLSAELPQGLKKQGIKSIVTVHDLIFMRFPDLYKAVDRNIYKKKVLLACKRADLIVAISQQTKNDIIELLKVDADKIKVVYPGIDPVFWQNQDSSFHRVMVSYNLPERYALFVGTLEPRKNPVLLAKACIAQKIPLVLIGRKTDYWNEFTEKLNSADQQWIFTPRVERNTDLAAIYQMADLFVYPSIFEGFGLPVLEALACKVPVITSNISSLPEAAGPSSQLVNLRKSDDLTKTLGNLWQDASKRKQMAEQGYQHALKFSDKELAQTWHNIYHEL